MSWVGQAGAGCALLLVPSARGLTELLSWCGEQGWSSHLCPSWSRLTPAPTIARCPLQCQLIKLKS